MEKKMSEGKEITDDCNRRNMNVMIDNEKISEISKATDQFGQAKYSGISTFQPVNSKFPDEGIIDKKFPKTSEKLSSMEEITIRALKLSNISKRIILMNLERDINKEIQLNTSIPDLDPKELSMDNSEPSYALKVLATTELMVEQAVKRCSEEVVNEVVSEFEAGILSLIALKPINTKSSRRKRKSSNETRQSQEPSTSKSQFGESSTDGMVKKVRKPEILVPSSSKPDFEESSTVEMVKKPEMLVSSTSKPQFEESSTSGMVKKVKTPEMLKHRACRIEQLKAARKEADIFISILEEIERMNDFYRQDVLDKNRQIRELHQNTKHVNENLSILEEVPNAVITIKNERGEPYANINVYEFGLNLYSDLSSYLVNTKKLNEEYNSFRINFHGMCEAFTMTSIEIFIGTATNNVTATSLDIAKGIYKEYFEDDKFEFMYDLLSMDLKHLQKKVQLFDVYLDELGEQLF